MYHFEFVTKYVPVTYGLRSLYELSELIMGAILAQIYKILHGDNIHLFHHGGIHCWNTVDCLNRALSNKIAFASSSVVTES